MTIRDEFARTALAVACREFWSPSEAPEGDTRIDIGWPWDDYDEMAESCYAIADAMMRARIPKLRARRKVKR